MEDARLSASEQEELQRDLNEAPADLKQAFCGCWQNVKGLLEWLRLDGRRAFSRGNFAGSAGGTWFSGTGGGTTTVLPTYSNPGMTEA